MFDLESDYFLKKFKDLWQSGLDAHIVVETHAAQSLVDLCVRIGHATGPSRQCRRARRSAARQQNEESESIREEVEKVCNAAKRDIGTLDAPIV